MKDWKRIGVFALAVAAVTLIDHGSKLIATAGLADGVRYSYLADTLRLEAAYNTGAILGLGSQLPNALRSWVMPAVTVVVLLWVSAMLIRETKMDPAFIGLSLVWGGGFSNLMDRLAYGKVFDFFTLGVGTLRTGISNLADVAIMAGIPLILIGWLWSSAAREQSATVIE